MPHLRIIKQSEDCHPITVLNVKEIHSKLETRWVVSTVGSVDLKTMDIQKLLMKMYRYSTVVDGIVFIIKQHVWRKPLSWVNIWNIFIGWLSCNFGRNQRLNTSHIECGQTSSRAWRCHSPAQFLANAKAAGFSSLFSYFMTYTSLFIKCLTTF